MKKPTTPVAIDPFKHYVCPKCGTNYSWSKDVVLTMDQLVCVFDKSPLDNKTQKNKHIEELKNIQKPKNKITLALIYRAGCAISKVVYNNVQKISKDKRFNIVCYEAGLHTKDIEQFNVTTYPTVIFLIDNVIHKVLKNVDITIANIEQTINKIETNIEEQHNGL